MLTKKKRTRYGLRGEIPNNPNYSKEITNPIFLDEEKPLAPTLMIETPENRAKFEKGLMEWGERLHIRIWEEQLRKLSLLKEHYNISSGDGHIDMILLALALAEQHIEGFTYHELLSVGRPKIWDNTKLLLLYCSVKKIIKEQNMSVESACLELADSKYWKSSNEENGKDPNNYNKVLEKRFYEAQKSSYVKVLVRDLSSSLSEINPNASEDAIMEILLKNLQPLD